MNVNDPDKNEELIISIQKETGGIAPLEAEKQAKEILYQEVQKTFSNSALNDYIENVRRVHEQIIDNENIDTVEFSGWNKDSKEKAEVIISDFKQFLLQHKDEITALKIFYDQPYSRREITYKMIKEVLEILKTEKPSLAPLRVWKAYEQIENVNDKSPTNELITLVSLIRRVTALDDVLTAYDKTVDKNFQRWVFQKQAGALKFNEEQMVWLRMIKEHIVSSFHIERDDLDYSPFDSKGGIGKLYDFFGEIDNGEIILNSIGKIVEKQWLWLQEQYLYVYLDEFVIMPNHFHGILIIDSSVEDNTGGNGRDEKERNGRCKIERNGRDRSLQQQKIKSVSELIGAFKTTSSKLIHLLADEQGKEWSPEKRKEWSRPFPSAEKFQWQKSFHDRIIRNDRELDNIRNYIKNNPLKWQLDIENQGQNSNEKQRNDYYDQIINE